MTRISPPRWRAACVLATMTLLAGCAAAVPQPHPQPAPAAPPPVLTQKQFTAVASRISDGLAQADAALDTAQLTGVTSGPATAIRTAQYRVVSSTKDTSLLTALPSGLQSEVIPTTQTWPRVAYAVTEQPANLEAQRLAVFQQTSARQNYTLWGWVRLFPGTEVPAFPQSTAGTAAVTDSVGLVATIDDTITHYVDYLNKGKSSAFSASFGEDDFATSVFDRRAERSTALTSIKGSYSYTVAPVADDATDVVALRTVQGGAVVVVSLTATEVGKGPKGSKVLPDDVERALAGTNKTSNVLTVSRTMTVAFSIPATGSASTVTVLGAESVRTAAKTS